jgi:hypothetical protein
MASFKKNPSALASLVSSKSKKKLTQMTASPKATKLLESRVFYTDRWG